VTEIFVGIDPGASGAIALYNPVTSKIEVEDMPTATMNIAGKNRRRVIEPVLAEIIRGWYSIHDLFAVVEQVGAMPGQGVTSMFSFGQSFGIVTGVLAGVGIPFETVTPQHWKKITRTPKGKDGSRAMASKLFPKQADLFRLKKHDGRSDAVMLAMTAQVLRFHEK